MAGGEDLVQMAQAAREVAGDVQDQDAVLFGHLLVKMVKGGGSHADHRGLADRLARDGTGSVSRMHASPKNAPGPSTASATASGVS